MTIEPAVIIDSISCFCMLITNSSFLNKIFEKANSEYTIEFNKINNEYIKLQQEKNQLKNMKNLNL